MNIKIVHILTVAWTSWTSERPSFAKICWLKAFSCFLILSQHCNTHRGHDSSHTDGADQSSDNDLNPARVGMLHDWYHFWSLIVEYWRLVSTWVVVSLNNELTHWFQSKQWQQYYSDQIEDPCFVRITRMMINWVWRNSVRSG